jgi:hypothetical protein
VFGIARRNSSSNLARCTKNNSVLRNEINLASHIGVGESMTRSVTRWEARLVISGYLKDMRKALQDSADEPDPITGTTGPRADTLEQDWRRDAEAAGLTPREVEEGWVWFHRDAFEAPPVLEERAQRAARETMPDSVRRVWSRNPMYRFVGYDPDLLDDLGLSVEDDLQAQAEAQRFWEDIGFAYSDPSALDARQAIDRLADLVHLKPEHLRRLAAENDTTPLEEKRRLTQEAVVLSLGVANDRIRVGKRKVKDDPGHPITLEEVFGREVLQRILNSLTEADRMTTSEARDHVQRSLSGPFRPAHLADRDVYRRWLTKEIQRRTEELLGEDLDDTDVGRAGGSRRRDISYDETEPLSDVPDGELGANTQGLTEKEMHATGDQEDQERTSFRTADEHTRLLKASEQKDRIELELAHRIDWQRALDRILEYVAPVLRRYIECIRQEPLLWDDSVAAARQLGWGETKVRDVKRRAAGYIAQIAAEQRCNALLPNAL